MKLVFSDIQDLTIEFEKLGLIPVYASETLFQMSENKFAFKEQLEAAESIHSVVGQQKKDESSI